MKILIYGATETGYIAASQFGAEHDITLLDEQERLPERFNSLDIHYISGSGTDVSLLEAANITGMDIFVACSGLDEANIIACWTIKRIADIETVCFVQRMELYRNLMFCSQSRFQTPYDIDVVIWPEKLLTQDIFRVVTVPDATDVEYFANGRVKLFEYRIKKDSVIRDKRVMDCRFPQNVLIVGITRNSELFIPKGSTTVAEGDKVVFMGTDQGLDLLTAKFFQHHSGIRKVVVIGGGSVGFLLAEQLEHVGIHVTIIEVDRKRCNFLADNLKKSLVLQGDGTDFELLESESVGESDAVICVTDNDEKNLLCSLLIKQMSSCRIVARVSNSQTSMLFERVGVDIVVSPHQAAMKDLMNLVQSRYVNILALIEGGQGEVVRITLPEGFPETRIADLAFKARAIIGVVQRGRQVLIPNGDTIIREGDYLKLFTMAEDVETIKKMFSI